MMSMHESVMSKNIAEMFTLSDGNTVEIWAQGINSFRVLCR